MHSFHSNSCFHSNAINVVFLSSIVIIISIIFLYQKLAITIEMVRKDTCTCKWLYDLKVYEIKCKNQISKDSIQDKHLRITLKMRQEN